MQWARIFGVVLDMLWNRRNDLVFQNAATPPHVLIVTAKNMVFYIECATSDHGVVKQFGRHHTVRWHPPLEGWTKVNTGVAFSSTAGAVSGGVVRDESGNFMVAFSSNHGTYSIMHVEYCGRLFSASD